MELISKVKLYNEILKIENQLLETAKKFATCTEGYQFDLINAKLSTWSMLKHLVDDFETEEQDLSVKYEESVSALNDINHAFKGYRQAIMESSCQSQRIDGIKIFTINPLSFIDIEISRWVEENKNNIKIVGVQYSSNPSNQIMITYSKIGVTNEN